MEEPEARAELRAVRLDGFHSRSSAVLLSTTITS